MLVEFKTVKSNLEENFEREKQAEMNGTYSLEFFRQRDYIDKFFVELDEVIDFEGARVYCNNEVHNCVFVRVGEEAFLRNILIEPEEFKKIIEWNRNCTIKTAEQIINSINNESYSTKI